MNSTQSPLKKAKLTRAEILSRAIEKVSNLGLHFSKIASSYKFENDATSYLQWVIRFGAEMDNYGLSDVLITNPESIGSLSVVTDRDPLNAQHQKTVYHMILKCVPKEATLAVTTSLPVVQRTGFAAWVALRQLYIGDERAYIINLEEKFNSLQWNEGELWPSFEIRFDSLVNDLQAIGHSKDEYQQKVRLMKSIQESDRRDAEGGSIYTRLHVTNLIKEKEPYRTWLVAIRTEAQKIQDEIQSSKGKKRRNHDTQPSGDRVGEVSQVDSSPASSSSSHHPSRGVYPSNTPFQSRPKEACRNFMRGHCRFGATCRFSHNPSSDSTDTANTGKGAPKKFKVGRPCFNFRDGKCTRGNQCRFMHTTTPPSTNMNMEA